MLTDEIVRQRIALPYELKVAWAQSRIKEWYYHFSGQVHVAFSGGQDSQVLLHLVRSIFPEVPAVFCAEPTFPEVYEVVRRTPNVTVLKPKMSFIECVRKWGFPVISKRICQSVREAKSAGPESRTFHLCVYGESLEGKPHPKRKIPTKWLKLLDAPFKVTDMCCRIIKKQPGSAYERKTGRYPYVGTLACESSQRMLTYKTYGCNGPNLTRPRSLPLAIWTPADIARYQKEHGIVRAACYEMGYERTGCMFCGFGCHLRKPNQFQLMKETHPKAYKVAMDVIGWRPVLEWLEIPH